MNRIIKKLSAISLTASFICVSILSGVSFTSHAAQSTTKINNAYYDFGSEGSYAITGVSSSGTSSSTLGTLSITGNTTSINNVNGYTAFEVKSDVVKFDYSIGSLYTTDNEYDWHIITDKTKDFDGGKLDSNIQNGAVLVQASLNGEKWITEAVYYDVLGDKSTYSSNIYNSKTIQQINGCYYRIIVLYKLEKRVADTSYGPISISNYEEKRCAEVYSFYLIDSGENRVDATKPTDEPRMELGEKTNTGKDNGFSGNVLMDDDPHFGWDIGTFYVNGFTRSTVDANDNTTVFIKTLGDRVTLWFNLSEDINALDNNSHLSIYSDTNGYDQYFEVRGPEFKRGTLIIRYTDYQGVKHSPIVYTDFLAACATTGADTKVELFEEGDYEVALDYEILNDEGIDEYYNYRIFFKFKIRNGNCMAYPFDLVTGSELGDGSITPNGFRLDLAQSRYLNIDVIRYSLKLVDGVYVTDSRENNPAKDGDSYTKEGVYQFTVKNLYTNAEDTSKIIYVGTAPIYKALARGIYSLDQINAMLSEGGVLEEDGTITMPIPLEEEQVVEEELGEVVAEVVDEQIIETEPVSDIEPVPERTTETPEVIENSAVEEKNGNHTWIIFVVIVFVIAGVVLVKKKGLFKKTSEKEEDNHSDSEKENN